MRSTEQQELFKAMSNRTRTKPQEMYAKFNTNLTQLQEQIFEFNKTQEKLSVKVNREPSLSDASLSVRLKSMTQPKYQSLLLDCRLPETSQNSPKHLKMQKKFSTKSGKSFNSAGLGSSINSFIGFKSNTQSKLVQSKLIEWNASKLKNKTNIQSTMLQTGQPSKSNPSNKYRPMEESLFMAESIVIPNQEKPLRIKPKKISKNLKQMIEQKQNKLQNEWEKTENYRGKIKSYIGQQDFLRHQKMTLAQTRVIQVIDKIQRSRAKTASGINSRKLFTDRTE